LIDIEASRAETIFQRASVQDFDCSLSCQRNNAAVLQIGNPAAPAIS
jgi:hypothetical protein